MCKILHININVSRVRRRRGDLHSLSKHAHNYNIRVHIFNDPKVSDF